MIVVAILGIIVLSAGLRSLTYIAKRYRARLIVSGKRDIPSLIFPSRGVSGKMVETIYKHSSTARPEDTVFRSMVNYFHRPADIHQERLPLGELYSKLARATSRVLSLRAEDIRDRADRYIREEVEKIVCGKEPWRRIRLWDFIAPASARFLFELVFHERLPENRMHLFYDAATDVLQGIKGIVAPDMDRRLPLLAYLHERILIADGCREIFDEDPELTPEIKAKHLQGVFFQTGIIQITECVCHTLVEISKNPQVAARMLESDALDGQYADDVVAESLRLFPLFGVNRRLAAKDIEVSPSLTIPAGVGVVVDFEAHQRTGHPRPRCFLPERWRTSEVAQGGYMPFGLGARRCPAEKLSKNACRAFVVGVIRELTVHSPIQHTRTLDGRALCCLTPGRAQSGAPLRSIRALIRLQDTLEQLQYAYLKMTVFPKTIHAALQPPAPGGEPLA
jgi:hypothetical protein